MRVFTDYSIGFLTRHCFRQCQFCVNRNSKHVDFACSLDEFFDPQRKKIMLYDDNFLGYPHWRDLIEPVKRTGKPFVFKQGLDERLLTETTCQEMSLWKYDGDFLFAFDNIDDADLIQRKCAIWRKHVSKNTKFFCFTGFDRNGRYDGEFWLQDIVNLFKRIEILSEYHCMAYIMRHENYQKSPYRGMYINIASWCNQPSFFKKKSFREFCFTDTQRKTTQEYCNIFEQEHPSIAKLFYDKKFGW